MDKDYLYKLVKERITEKRYNHTLGVIKEALFLGKIYNLDLEKVEIAALLHDSCKYIDLDIQKENLLNHFPKDEIDMLPKGAYHSYSGYLYAKELGITDKDIIDPIKYHTLGKTNMSLYELVLFISDFSEEGREFEEAKVAHELAIKDLNRSALYIFNEELKWLKNENKYIAPSIYENIKYLKELLNDK